MPTHQDPLPARTHRTAGLVASPKPMNPRSRVWPDPPKWAHSAAAVLAGELTTDQPQGQKPVAPGTAIG